MRRAASPLALAAGLTALSACASDPTSGGSLNAQAAAKDPIPSVAMADGLVASDPAVLLTWTNPTTGEVVTVHNGGFGSAIAVHPSNTNRFYLLTDRGPNIDYNGGIAFVKPDFSPEIGVFQRNDGRLKLHEVITLKDQACKPLTGLPLPAGQAGSTNETAYDLAGSVIPGDPNGIDSEGLIVLERGGFWVSDEYGPFLVHFDDKGCTIERLAPAASGRGLPLVLAARRPNRGMEGVATPDGGKTLVGVMQSPLDNPKAAGRASRLVRIVVVNTETGASMQYAYLLDTPSLANSDIVALGGSRYVVVERDGNFIQSGSAAKRLYQIDLAGATDISDPGNGAAGLLVGGQTLEELTANQVDPAGVLRAAGYEPVAKQLAVDLLVAYPGYAHDKGEGLTLVAPGRIAVSNDDDFGVTTGTGGLVQKLIPGTTQTDFTEVVFVDLP